MQAGDHIKAHYTGYLVSTGQKFDSSHDKGVTFQFTVGDGRVIRCWDEGFVGLSVGTYATLTCPPEYAYGNRDIGNGRIPPNSSLKFDIEVVAIKPKPRDQRRSIAMPSRSSNLSKAIGQMRSELIKKEDAPFNPTMKRFGPRGNPNA